MTYRAQAALEPWQIRDIQDETRRGVTAEALAGRYGISVRSVKRYRRVRVERHYQDGWTAWFAYHGEQRPPQQLTKWEAA